MLVNIGKGIEMEINLDKLYNDGRSGHEEELRRYPVMTHAVMIGLRNILMDSHAGVTPEKAGDTFVEQSRATAEKKLDAMYNGEVRVAGTREGDPVKAEATRLAYLAICGKIRQAGKKVKSYDPKDLRAKSIELAQKYMEQARANIAAAKSLAKDLDIDLSDIG